MTRAMVTVNRKELSVQVDTDLLHSLSYIAAIERRELQEILEEAMWDYLVQKSGLERKPDGKDMPPSVHAVMVKYRRLFERLSQ